MAFRLQDHTGRQYTATPFGTLQPLDNAVNPGATVKGTVVFAIPQADTGLSLVYLPNASVDPTTIPIA